MRRCIFCLATVVLGWPTVGRSQVPKAPTDYTGVIEALDPFVAREVADKRLPALAIALVDNQTVVWAKGYGLVDPRRKGPATADTAFRFDSLTRSIAGTIPRPAEQGRPEREVAKGTRWTSYGRDFEAPAVGATATARDVARFLTVLFAGGKELDHPFWQGVQRGGARASGSAAGNSYAMVAQLDDKLGAVVLTSRDACNGVTQRLADLALQLMREARAGKALSPIETTEPVGAEAARRLEGRYVQGEDGYDLSERDGKLFMQSLRGGPRQEVRRSAKGLVVDDRQDFGPRLTEKGGDLVVEADRSSRTYSRVAVGKPGPVPEKWRGLIGEYGDDANALGILEKDGRLWAVYKYLQFAPLDELSADEFRAAKGAPLASDKLVFARDGKGRATRVEMGKSVLDRRAIDGEDGQTFKIKPQRPVEEIRREALKATPTVEKGDFRKPDLAELTALDATIELDLRYATDDNFMGTPLYPASAKAYLQRPAAEALARAHAKLAGKGYGLLIHDAYRPWYVTKMFWEATPEKQRLFVADPSQGSRHNRGCAVDLTLFERATGKTVAMVSGYDEFSDRAYPDYPGGTSLGRWHRELLRRAMEAEGFSVYEAEWWHFDFKDWRQYPILNATFEQLAK